MSVTYGVLIRRAAGEVARAAVALRVETVASQAEGIALLADYQDLLSALERHTRRLLQPSGRPGAARTPSSDRTERTALALADELAQLAGRPQDHAGVGVPSHWYAASLAVGAATELLATHADRSGLARSPDLEGVLASPEARRQALASLGDLTATALDAADALDHRLVQVRVFPRRERRLLSDPITAQVLAHETVRSARVSPEVGLDDLRTAHPLIDTSHPLAELGDRLAHLRHHAWAAAQADRPAVDDLKIFAALGVSVSAHAEAAAGRRTPEAEERSAVVPGEAMSRALAWRTVRNILHPWQTAEPARPAVIGHARRVVALLREVAPLGGPTAGAVRAQPDPEVVQALRAAVQITTTFARWNAATADALPQSRPMMAARALTGDQVTDDATLAAAKLAGSRVEVPAVAYRDLLDAYEVAGGNASPRTGVLEPVLAAQLGRAAVGFGLGIERR